MAKAKRPRVESRAWEAQQHRSFLRRLRRDPETKAKLKRDLEHAQEDVRTGRTMTLTELKAKMR